MYNYFSPLTENRFLDNDRIMVQRGVELEGGGQFTYYYAYELCETCEYARFSTMQRLDDGTVYKPIDNYELAMIHIKAAFPEMNDTEVNSANGHVIYTSRLREWLKVNSPEELVD